MSREGAVLLTLIVYKVCLVAIGLYYERRTHDGVDFYLGGRKLGPLVAAVSASASSSSAWTLLGVSGAAYAWGFSSLWLFPSCVGGFLINWYILAPSLQKLSREQGSVTVTEVLATLGRGTTSKAIRVLASVIILASLVTYVASQFQGAGKTFAETFDISSGESILIGSGIVVLYTMLGGFWAVSVTDTLQGLLMALTSLILPIAALSAVGGFTGLADGLVAAGDESLMSLTRNLPFVSAVGFVLGLLGIGLGYPGQPHVVNRFMALADTRNAVKNARRIAIAWAVVVYTGMILVGLCGRVLYPDLADSEVAFVTLTNSLFSPVVAGVMLAAVLSAIMSTADSQLLVAASTVSHDLRLAEKSRLSPIARSRLVVLLLSIAAVWAAVLGSQEIFSQVLFAWAAMGSAFGPLLLVLVFGGRVSARMRFAAILVGFLSSVLAFYLVPVGSAWKGGLERMLPFFLSLAIALVGAWYSRRRS